jgi:hypothetical protein
MPPLQLDEEGSDKDSDVVSHLTLALPVAGGWRPSRCASAAMGDQELRPAAGSLLVVLCCGG